MRQSNEPDPEPRLETHMSEDKNIVVNEEYAYEEGAEAYSDGKSRWRDNPYDPSTKLWAAWDGGWTGENEAHR